MGSRFGDCRSIPGMFRHRRPRLGRVMASQENVTLSRLSFVLQHCKLNSCVAGRRAPFVLDASEKTVDYDVSISERPARVQDRLVSSVYDELKRIARAHSRQEQFNATLQTTALVHEAWLRLAESDTALQPRTETHLKALTSRVIRHVLVDYARQATARKRSPDSNDISELQFTLIDPGLDVHLLDLDEALHALAGDSPRLAELVEYRFFGGMSIPETAEILGLSTRTLERDWIKARAYLLKLLRERQT